MEVRIFDKDFYTNVALSNLKIPNAYYIGKVFKGVSGHNILRVQDELAKMEIAFNKDEAYRHLDNLYKTKLDSMKAMLNNGRLPTAEVQAEYNTKLKAIEDGNVEYFEAEAKLLGTTAKEEFDKVEKVSKSIKVAEAKLGAMGGIRRIISKEIEVSIVNAHNLISKLQDIDVTTTSLDDILSIVSEVE